MRSIDAIVGNDESFSRLQRGCVMKMLSEPSINARSPLPGTHLYTALGIKWSADHEPSSPPSGLPQTTQMPCVRMYAFLCFALDTVTIESPCQTFLAETPHEDIFAQRHQQTVRTNLQINPTIHSSGPIGVGVERALKSQRAFVYLISTVSTNEHHLSAAHTTHASTHLGMRVGGSGHIWDAIMFLSLSVNPKSSSALRRARNGCRVACPAFCGSCQS